MNVMEHHYDYNTLGQCDYTSSPVRGGAAGRGRAGAVVHLEQQLRRLRGQVAGGNMHTALGYIIQDSDFIELRLFGNKV